MNFIITIFSLLLAWPCVNSITVTGYTGGGVSIRCNYSQEYKDNAKYFCKDNTRPKSIDVIKTVEKNTWITEGRFSLYDNIEGGFFTVNITELQLTDDGTYWCAVDISLAVDKYSEVQLKVQRGPKPSTPTLPQPKTKSPLLPETTPVSVTRECTPKGTTKRAVPSKPAMLGSWMYLALGLGVLVLVFGLALFLLTRARLRGRKAPNAASEMNGAGGHAKERTCEYAEIKHLDPMSDKKNVIRSHTADMAIYSNMSSVTGPPNSPNYATINFVDDLTSTTYSNVKFTEDRHTVTYSAVQLTSGPN